MTAVALAQGEFVDCLTCNGAGETGTGERERETGVYITTDCQDCGGDGHVDARYVETCEGCKSRLWAGTGCSHHGTQCEACKPYRCDDCLDEVRGVRSAEDLRVLLMFGGLS